MDNDLNESEIFSLIKKGYIDKIRFIFGTNVVPEKEKSRFSFIENKNIELNLCLYTWRKSKWYLFFANRSTQNKPKLNIYDFQNQTNNYDFEKLNSRQRVAWLIDNDLLKLNSHDIISSSIQTNIPITKKDFLNFGENWADQEYEQTNTVLQKRTPIENFSISNQKFFIDRYHFDDMLSSINDDQFTDEFNQCLFAYNHEKWFLCATGLGSCLEHLMYIIIANYGDFKNLGKNPTFKDYIAKFKQPPISISSRQATFISLLFMARNSVDHHNTGNTQKNICDLLLDGISDIYNDYYSDSVLAKKVD